ELGTEPDYKEQQFEQTLNSYLNEKLGADNNLADTWTEAESPDGTEMAVAGSWTVLSVQQTSNAFIAPGALVNQDLSRRTADHTQDVLLAATATNSAVNLGGSVQTLGVTSEGGEDTT